MCRAAPSLASSGAAFRRRHAHALLSNDAHLPRALLAFAWASAAAIHCRKRRNPAIVGCWPRNLTNVARAPPVSLRSFWQIPSCSIAGRWCSFSASALCCCVMQPLWSPAAASNSPGGTTKGRALGRDDGAGGNA
eukprot:7388432-Prymnesium_polylepis.1